MWSYIIAFNLLCCIATAVFYDSYEGVPITDEKLAEYKEQNISEICAIEFEPCDENEYRRCDASCNNLKYPSRGPYYTPYLKMLPSNFSDNYEPRKTKSGKELPSARYSRSIMLKVGETISEDLAMGASYFPEFLGGDTTSIHDIENYVFNITDCSTAEGKKKYWCATIDIPENDYAHRFDHTKYFNQTRPQSYHNMGCAPNSSPNRMGHVTTFFDLSPIYEYKKGVISRVRTYEGGKMKVEIVDGRAFPSDAVPTTTCYIKEAKETDCVRYVPNGVLGTNLFTTWWWRFHNMVAETLAELNPSWDDEKLFNVAKDITISYYTQMMYYEYFALVLGEDRLIEAGILLNHTGFRDDYDEDIELTVALEFPYIMRWFHKTQNGMLKLYNKDGSFIREQSIVDYTLRVHDLAYDDNMVGLTHGMTIQPSGSFDEYAVHPEMSEVGLGPFQYAIDVPTGDLNNGRYLGLAPYTHYRDYCSKYTKNHTTFEDLLDVIPSHKLEELKQIYSDPIDIELMAGTWAEGLLEGSWVTPTVYCIIAEQLHRSIVGDRYWYESSTRPHPLSYEQLQEIRKASLAGLLCAVGDDVTEVQRRAFQIISSENPRVSCSEIPQLDLSLWQEDSSSDAE